MKKIISILLAVLMLLPSMAFAREYTPAEIALVMKKMEIMEGDPDGNLRLEDAVTRAEFTKMAVNSSPYRNLVSATLTVSPFGDVTYKHWAAPYVWVAVGSGIVTGYPDATFRPDNEVKLEEALNILLKMLGYTDSDFGLSYPYGQIQLAKNLEITDGVSALAGDSLTRAECMTLVYNTLRTAPKGQSAEYMNTIGYTLLEDTVVMATNATDTGVSAGYVALSDGSYKIPADFDDTWIGKRGTALIKNSKELLLFAPDIQRTASHTVYQVLGDKVITLSGGSMEELSLDDSLTVYHKSSRSTLSGIMTQLSTGDSIDLYYNAAGELEYGVVRTDGLKGPVTATGAETLTALGLTDPTVMKNGQSVGVSAVAANDILYYSPALNIVWCYDDSVTGVYTAATPNQDMPRSITVSGKEYQIETMEAFRKLSSGGTFAIGDTVTVLLGREGAVADVIAPGGSAESTGEVYGYLLSTGSGIFTEGQGSYSSYTARLALPDGSIAEYEVKKDYIDYKNSVVKVSFTGGSATLSPVTNTSSVSGYFDWEDRTIGGTTIASNVKILDVADLDRSSTGLYTSVQGQRLHGITLRQSQILYAETNGAGEVTTLILKEVTGDMYRYGVVSESTYSSANTMGSAGAYLYEGQTYAIQSPNETYRISRGQAVKVAAGGGSVDTMSTLQKLSGVGTSVTATTITVGKTEYPLSDTVQVYERRNLSGSIEYALIPLSEIMGDSDYTLTVYMDKSASSGGRVRIIIAE